MSDNLNALQNWWSFKRDHFVGDGQPTKATAKKNILSGLWPGRVDADQVYIYVHRFELNLPAPHGNDTPIQEHEVEQDFIESRPFMRNGQNQR